MFFSRLGPRKSISEKARRLRGGSRFEEPIEEEEDEPTAPISPLIELSRSPHDRHRDLAVGKGVIRQIDRLDSMIEAAEKKRGGNEAEPLRLIRDEFTALLSECSITPYEFDEGIPVTTEMRKRIQIIGGTAAEGQPTRIAKTVLCGFLYEHGEEEILILRKAEVQIQ
ncbi:MAG: hypothetical protein P1U85_09840 [Verrucomicrobiales bacterium]|jgi:hypothetical protein|nr:hypothetical protein [Verrucomicrobiales bacterium]